LILDLQTLKLKYVVMKLIDDSDGRLTRQRAHRTGEAGASLRATYFGKPEQDIEPFALLQRIASREPSCQIPNQRKNSDVRQGLGDCFLLTFMRKTKDDVHVMICGLLQQTTNSFGNHDQSRRRH
jgi:hypothetical protein